MKCPEPNLSTWLREHIRQKNHEKDHVSTDLVTDEGGEILGHSVDPLSSASGTLETVDGRLGTNSDLGWSFNSNLDYWTNIGLAILEQKFPENTRSLLS